MSQTQKEHSQQSQDDTATAEAKDLRDEKLTDDVDAILDEIDGVLEENAETFVNEYIQRGGE